MSPAASLREEAGNVRHGLVALSLPVVAAKKMRPVRTVKGRALLAIPSTRTGKTDAPCARFGPGYQSANDCAN
jgi:hypothetical protein